MKRDPYSKAIIFPIDPNKKSIREQRAKVIHHSDEIQFLADCINYQQSIIEEQSKTISNLVGGGSSENSSTDGSSAKKVKTSK